VQVRKQKPIDSGEPLQRAHVTAGVLNELIASAYSPVKARTQPRNRAPSVAIMILDDEGSRRPRTQGRADLVLTVKVPKPRNSTRSRLTNAASISSIMALTTFSTSLLNRCGFCAAMFECAPAYKLKH